MDGCAAIYPALAAITVAQLFGVPLGVHRLPADRLRLGGRLGRDRRPHRRGRDADPDPVDARACRWRVSGLLLAIDPILDMMRTATNVGRPGAGPDDRRQARTACSTSDDLRRGQRGLDRRDESVRSPTAASGAGRRWPAASFAPAARSPPRCNGRVRRRSGAKSVQSATGSQLNASRHQSSAARPGPQDVEGGVGVRRPWCPAAPSPTAADGPRPARPHASIRAAWAKTSGPSRGSRRRRTPTRRQQLDRSDSGVRSSTTAAAVGPPDESGHALHCVRIRRSTVGWVGAELTGFRAHR